MAHFQVKLGGHWKDYDKHEDKMLKQVYKLGHDKAKYTSRGNNYEYDFKRMVQISVESGKEREIRAPAGKNTIKRPSAPVVKAGPTMVVKVPPGGPGTVIQVPHPKDKNVTFAVEVPAHARIGAAMIVPIPPLPRHGNMPVYDPAAQGGGGGGGGGAPPAAGGGGGGGAEAGGEKPKEGMGMAGKAGVAVGGAALVGGCAVAGGIIGHAAQDGAFDGAGDVIADGAGEVGDVVAGFCEDFGDIAGDGLEDAGDWLVDAGEDAGDFIMDLF